MQVQKEVHIFILDCWLCSPLSSKHWRLTSPEIFPLHGRAQVGNTRHCKCSVTSLHQCSARTCLTEKSLPAILVPCSYKSLVPVAASQGLHWLVLGRLVGLRSADASAVHSLRTLWTFFFFGIRVLIQRHKLPTSESSYDRFMQLLGNKTMTAGE